jgi:hypothetical protein
MLCNYQLVLRSIIRLLENQQHLAYLTFVLSQQHLSSSLTEIKRDSKLPFSISTENPDNQRTKPHLPLRLKLNPTEKKRKEKKNHKNLTKERCPVGHGKNKKLKPYNQD